MPVLPPVRCTFTATEPAFFTALRLGAACLSEPYGCCVFHCCSSAASACGGFVGFVTGLAIVPVWSDVLMPWQFAQVRISPFWKVIQKRSFTWLVRAASLSSRCQV